MKSIREKVVSLLKLDDKGRIEKFFNSQVKKINEHISKHEANLKIYGVTYETNLKTLTNKLDSAEEYLEDMYINVDLNEIKTNFENYSISYWNKISDAESNIKNIQERIKTLGEEYNKQIETTNEQINKHIARVKRIS
jgi:isocitrate dehydrogenase kinase/phosphatase